MLCIKFPLGICTKWPISIIHYICSFDTIEVRTKMATEGYINLNYVIDRLKTYANGVLK